MTEEIMMRVRRLEPQQAKEQLEHKENELEKAAHWLNEQHAQVREMEAQLLEKEHAFKSEVTTARDQYGNFQAEVRSAQERHIQVKDELARSVAQARSRQDATEARIIAESNEVSHCKAALLRESHEFRAQMAGQAAGEAHELRNQHARMIAESRAQITHEEFQLNARVTQSNNELQDQAQRIHEQSEQIAAEQRGQAQRLQQQSEQIAVEQREVFEAAKRVQQAESKHEADLRQAQLLDSLKENESHSASSIELKLRHELQYSKDQLKSIESRERDEQQRRAAAEAERTSLRGENSAGQGALRSAETRARELEKELMAAQHSLEETRAAASELARAVSVADAERAAQQGGEWDSWMDWPVGPEIEEEVEIDEPALTYQADSVPTWSPEPLSAPTATGTAQQEIASGPSQVAAPAPTRAPTPP